MGVNGEPGSLEGRWLAVDGVGVFVCMNWNLYHGCGTKMEVFSVGPVSLE